MRNKHYNHTQRFIAIATHRVVVVAFDVDTDVAPWAFAASDDCGRRHGGMRNDGAALKCLSLSEGGGGDDIVI